MHEVISKRYQKPQTSEHRAKIQLEANTIFNQFNHLKIVTTIGICPIGSYKTNGVPVGNLEAHIFYNLAYRPSRALIINNCVAYEGHVDKEVLQKTLKIVKDIKLDKDTQPYV